MICQGAYDGKLNFVHRACVMSYISQYINLIRCFMCYAWLTSCILIPCGCCHGRAVQKQWTFDSMSFNIWDFFSPRLRFSIGHCYFITLALTMCYFITFSIGRACRRSWSSPWSDHIWAESERDDILFCGTSMELRSMHEYMSSQRNSWKYVWTAFRSYQQSTHHRPHKLPCHRPHAVAAILNSDSKMPASTGQYGSQCGSITMRYSIIHSQCWLSIATYKYLRTRQWHWSHRGGLEPLVFAVPPKGSKRLPSELGSGGSRFVPGTGHFGHQRR